MVQPPDEPRWPTYPGPEQVPAPTGPVPGVPAAYPSSSADAVVRPGTSPQDPLRIAAGASGVKKVGRWLVPPYLSVHGDLGSVRLDFQLAQPTSPVIRAHVSGGVGSILIVVPQGWGVQLDRLSPGIGSMKSEVAEESTGNSPVLVLSGSLAVGSLRVRYPRGSDRRVARRWLAKEQKQLR
ncbi:MAG: hypothetical protein QM779_00040 [Propionicimonas sp.]|uniref:hypothetical protein n=1 Tax=Propionicimonas sp. TaxID=1955623 RepID=UPI003D141EA1